MWTFSVGTTSGVTASQINSAMNVVEDAADYWGRYIDFGSGILDVTVNFVSLGETTLAQAGGTFFSVGVDGGNTVFQAGSILELQDGTDPNGAGADIEIDINSDTINDGDFFFGGLSNANVPFAQYDLFTVLLHEIAHGLGFLSFLEEGGNDIAVYDLSVDQVGLNYFFTGANAMAVYGGDVPLYSEPSHIGDSDFDLLNAALFNGTRVFLSELDIAMLKDIGLPILGPTGGNDVLYGFHASFDGRTYVGGDDVIALLGGNDWYDGLNGDDAIDGGDGADTLFGQGGSDTLRGGAGNDSLSGGVAADEIRGELDDDNIDAGGGHDTVYAGFGNDTAFGGAGDDYVTGGDGADSLDGGNGDDYVIGGDGADIVIGGAGRDSLVGNDGDDTLDGGNLEDTLRGQGDDDLMSGGNDDDSLAGGYGADTLNGDGGLDSLRGGGGSDTVIGGIGHDLVTGGVGDDLVDGQNGNDTVIGGGGADLVLGGAGEDSVTGGAGNDVLDGGNLNDTLRGGGDDDLLDGGNDDDLLYGGTGNDTLIGGAGNDTLYGNAGDDLFIFNAGDGDDEINGFQAGAATDDVIDLSSFDGVFDDFSDVTAAAADVSGDVVIDLGGGNSITITNVVLASLHADDFLF
ncbi:calcium-binding protein [Hyphococcus sp.]|uniref:calcium-binding protein n=1 Tax=Hyphococcus sp. TaxID=2038636 RepID=UPI0035C70AC5